MIQTARPLRLNVGCGPFRLEGWLNLDENPTVGADLHVCVPPLPFEANRAEEIYAGHYLEHLDPEEADVFLEECRRVLVPGGKLGLVVPDTRAIVRAYLEGVAGRDTLVEGPPGQYWSMANLDHVCAYFLFSTYQESPHQWAYDLSTLRRALERHGFLVLGEIDRYSDGRLGTGRWYQCGLDAVKSEE